MISEGISRGDGVPVQNRGLLFFNPHNSLQTLCKCHTNKIQWDFLRLWFKNTKRLQLVQLGSPK